MGIHTVGIHTVGIHTVGIHTVGTWHRAMFAETYLQNYIFGGAYAIKPI